MADCRHSRRGTRRHIDGRIDIFVFLCPYRAFTVTCYAFQRTADLIPTQPFFILLTLGYKIIFQTKMVQLDEMDFQTPHFRQAEPDNRRPSRRERVLGALLVI
jgi:amino acid permease